MRLRGTSTEEMEEEGLETDGAITSKSKLQSKIKGLSGVDILTDTGAYKSTYQILSEIADVWESMNDMDQAALLELLAGKRAGSVMSAILENPETLKDAFESASESTGSALEENEKYLDSIQGKMDLFTNALQTMWNDELNSDIIKFFVSLGTVLIKVLDTVGLLPSAFIIVSLAIMKMNHMNLIEYFGSISESILKAGAKLKGYATSLMGTATASKTLTFEMLKQQAITEEINIVDAIRMATTKGLVLSEVELTKAQARRLMISNGVSTAEARSIADKLGLSAATQKLTLDTLQQAIVTSKLTAAEATQLGLATGLITASTSLTKAKAIEILTSQGVSKEKAKEIAATLGLGATTKTLTIDTIKLAIANGTLAPELGAVALGLFGVDVAAKGAAGGFTALWTAAWPLLAVMLAIAAVVGIVKLFDEINVSAKEASEQLKETKNNISSLESELDSLETKLDETKNKIAELEALPSLSLTQQEDLERLEREVELLEREIALKERQLAIEEKQLIKDAKTSISKNFYGDDGDKAYDLTNGGKIQEDRWFTAGESGIDVVNKAIEKYQKNANNIKEAEDLLLNWGEEDAKPINSGLAYELDINTGSGIYAGTTTKEEVIKAIEEAEATNVEIASSIEDFLNDPNYAGLSYGLDNDIDKFLDDFNQVQLKWEKALYGDTNKANAIQSIFGVYATDEMKNLKSDIDEILAGDDSWEIKNAAIENHLNKIDETSEGYQHLKFVMDEYKVTAKDIADYFTIEDGEFNSSTPEGIAKQYQTGIEVMEQFKAQEEEMIALGNKYNELVNGNVDYNKRPFVSPEDMKAIYPEFDGEIATTWDSDETYGDGKGGIKYTLKFTPILEDGTVLDEASYNEYINDIFAELDKANGDINKALEYDASHYKILINWQEGAVEYDENNESELDRLLGDIKDKHWDLQSANGLFELDKDGKFKAEADEFGKILEGMDEDARKTFISLAESVKNGEKSWDQAMAEFNIHGINRTFDLLDAEFEEINNEMFKGAADDINGFIDTVSELKAALEDVADTMDLVHTAQQQMNNSGRISVKTALELMQTTEDWDSILEITNGTIKLRDDAEQHLIQTELDSIKTQLEYAWTTAQSRYETALATQTELEYADNSDVVMTAESIKAEAIGRVSAVVVALGAAMDKLMSKEWASAPGAFLETYKSATEAVVAQSKTLTTNIDELKKDADNKKKMFDAFSGIDTVSEYKDNYDYDETPGDKYDETQKALEKLQKKYEHQISNYENQQTYLQNIIDKLEAENKGVSKKYYEDQIAIEQKKLDLYTKQRTELLSLLNSTAKGTDDWFEIADALWEVEHNIQESTLSMVEFRQSIIDLYQTAFDDLDKSHGDKDNFLSDQQDYIDKYNELLELQNKPITMAGYQEQIAIEEEKMANNISELADLRKTLADSMSSGYIKEGSEEWVEMQESIRETEAAILDNQIAIEEYKKELKSLSVEAFELVRGAFSNKNDFLTSQQDYVEGYADYLEALNVDVPAEVYDKLIEIEKEKRQNNVANLVSARAQFAEIEAQGYTAADEEWQDAYNQIIEIEKAIQDSDIAMAQWEQTLRELDFEKFERFISRLSDVRSEIDHIRNLMDGEDVAFEDGSWTEEGITSLGLLYQQIQIAKQESEAYAKQIDELNKQYEAGSISEEEYYEKLQELKEGQWDAIEAYKDAEDAIVDMEEARINMIEEGINEEIEAYEELIELKKEELDAERDLYDFKKKIADQSEEIADLERKIASLAGSTDLADIAERKKLEKELRDAQEGLDDTYYTHSMDQQGQALDDELESFRDAKEEYLEMLRETLENTEELINEKISELLLNADVVLDTLDEISEEHGVNLSGLLMKPWQDASAQSTAFKNTTEFNLDSLINEDGIVTVFSEDVKFKMAETFGASSYAAESFGTTVNTIIGQIQTTVYESTSPLTANLRLPWENVTSQDGPINTFSTQAKGAINTALVEAQNKAQAMTNNLTSPWKAGSNAVNTFSTDVKNALNQAVNDSRNAANQINSNMSSAYPSYTSSYTGNGNGNGNDNGNGNGSSSISSENALRYRALQEVLNSVFSANIAVDGIWGEQSKNALKNAQEQVRRFLAYNTRGATLPPVTGEYNNVTRQAFLQYFDIMAARASNNDHPEAVSIYNDAKKKLPSAFYAKGTLGTKRDEWAITDESWIGEEITLAAGKHGQLQYLKKGSAVMPSDISANLIEWGKLDPNALSMPTMGGSVNIMSNAVIQPNYEFNFDSLVHVDHCDEGTLKGLEKMVDNKLDYFSKQLNYSLKKFAR